MSVHTHIYTDGQSLLQNSLPFSSVLLQSFPGLTWRHWRHPGATEHILHWEFSPIFVAMWLSFSLHLSSKYRQGMDSVLTEALEHFPPLNISSFGAGPAQTKQQKRNPTARTTWLSTWPLLEPHALPPLTLSLPKWTLNFRSPSRWAVNWTLGRFDASSPQPWYPPPKWGSPLMTHPAVSGFFYALPSGPSPPQLPFLLLWIFRLSVVTFKIHLKFSGWNHPPSYDTSCFCRSGIWAAFGWTRLLLHTVSTGAILVVFN